MEGKTFCKLKFYQHTQKNTTYMRMHNLLKRKQIKRQHKEGRGKGGGKRERERERERERVRSDFTKGIYIYIYIYIYKSIDHTKIDEL